MLAVYTAEATDICRRTYTEAGFNSAQESALKIAHDSHFITTLIGEVDGKTRRIVLVGEQYHWQGTEGTRGLLDTFPVRGLESYPGGLALQGLLRLTYFVEGIARGKSGGSSIAYAKTHAELTKKLEGIVKANDLENKNDAELEAFRYNLGGQIYNGKELLALRLISPQIKNVYLEEGFTPTPTDTMLAWGIPAFTLGPRVSWIPAAVAIPTYMGNPKLAVGLIGAAALGYIVTAWGSIALVPEMGGKLRPRRDDQMAQNILSHFRENPTDDSMLVMVGYNHLSGIRDRLEKEGFANILVRESR